MCVTDAWLQLQKKLVDARLELLAELGAEHLLPLYRRLKVSALRITYIMSSVQITTHVITNQFTGTHFAQPLIVCVTSVDFRVSARFCPVRLGSNQRCRRKRSEINNFDNTRAAAAAAECTGHGTWQHALGRERLEVLDLVSNGVSWSVLVGGCSGAAAGVTWWRLLAMRELMNSQSLSVFLPESKYRYGSSSGSGCAAAVKHNTFTYE